MTTRLTHYMDDSGVIIEREKDIEDVRRKEKMHVNEYIGCVRYSNPCTALRTASALDGSVVGGQTVSAWVRRLRRVSVGEEDGVKRGEEHMVEEMYMYMREEEERQRIKEREMNELKREKSERDERKPDVFSMASQDLFIASVPSGSDALEISSERKLLQESCEPMRSSLTSHSALSTLPLPLSPNSSLPPSLSSSLSFSLSSSASAPVKLDVESMRAVPKLPKRNTLPTHPSLPLSLPLSPSIPLPSHPSSVESGQETDPLASHSTTSSLSLSTTSRSLADIPITDAETDIQIFNMLRSLSEFQKRANEKNPTNAKLKQRFVLGMKQCIGGVKANRVKVLFLAPDTECSVVIDTKLSMLIEEAKSRKIPIMYCLNRRKLGKSVGSTMRQSAIAVFDADGVYEIYRNIVNSIGAEVVKKNEY
eukprot:CAMPEP_0182420992 /NCGR_PEP_ID=MMETSP1167-20130531/6142_1 /TAXON_ID=2988 /ORGANISM="Mallomonas Sp, Strain CCMP3275" /LENGTH=421 /DNA_ID=CAMNT_0024597647 /DNA_START=182 /DNA_END=1447 /DNA_ORIENTATION=-